MTQRIQIILGPVCTIRLEKSDPSYHWLFHECQGRDNLLLVGDYLLKCLDNPMTWHLGLFLMDDGSALDKVN